MRDSGKEGEREREERERVCESVRGGEIKTK
jgi:hypothetical protein